MGMILTKDRFEQKPLNVSPEPREWIQAVAKVTVTAEIAGLRKDGHIDLIHLTDSKDMSLKIPTYTDTEERIPSREGIRIGGGQMNRYQLEVMEHLEIQPKALTVYLHSEDKIDYYTILVPDEDAEATIEISEIFCKLLDKIDSQYQFRFYPIPSSYFDVDDLPEGAIKCKSGGLS